MDYLTDENSTNTNNKDPENDSKTTDLEVVMTFLLKNICIDNFLGQSQIFKE